MMLTQQLSSGTVVALSMGELISVLVTLIGIVGGVIAFVRKDEQDNARLSISEKAIADLTLQVSKLTEQVQHLATLSTNPARRPKAHERTS